MNEFSRLVIQAAISVWGKGGWDGGGGGGGGGPPQPPRREK